MKLLILLSAVNVLCASHIKETKKCEGVSVHGKIHEKQVLINGLDRPYQLSYHEMNNSSMLYFSYNTGRLNESTFELGYIVIGDKIPTPIPEVTNGFATAVNAKENVIYFGGSDGIYCQNLSTPGEVTRLHHKYDIWDLFYRENLYFINFPKRRLHKHIAVDSSEIVKHIHEKIYQFAIDGDGDTFITNKTGVFMIKSGTEHRVHLKGPKIFRAVEVNRKGIVHFCSGHDVFLVNKKKYQLYEIAKLDHIFGLAFDKDDNIIYSDPHQIIRLIPKSCK